MKKAAIFFFVVIMTVFISTSVHSQDLKLAGKSPIDSSVSYKDGIYAGISRAKYVDEPYWGSVHLTLRNGLVTDISFVIRDSNLHETFNENYEKHFEGNPVYIQQSKNDWKGVQIWHHNCGDNCRINKMDNGQVDFEKKYRNAIPSDIICFGLYKAGT